MREVMHTFCSGVTETAFADAVNKSERSADPFMIVKERNGKALEGT
jgi:hypothetical protein